jgi:hypothetical protein
MPDSRWYRMILISAKRKARSVLILPVLLAGAKSM